MISQLIFKNFFLRVLSYLAYKLASPLPYFHPLTPEHTSFLHCLLIFVQAPPSKSSHKVTVATLVGKPWAMDMVDEGVSRSFKPWDIDAAAADFSATNGSKRMSSTSLLDSGSLN